MFQNGGTKEGGGKTQWTLPNVVHNSMTQVETETF